MCNCTKCNHTVERSSTVCKYKQAEFDGRMIISPCKPGAPVFYICWTSNGPEIFERPFKIEWVFQIGSTVFLEKDEAVAQIRRLKELQTLP